MRTAVVFAALLFVAAGGVCLFAPGYYAFLAGTIAATALVGIGLNILYGLTGEVSLGQIGFVALGAYGVAILETKVGLNFWPALVLSIALTSIVAAALSVPALRLTGPYLAMVTIAFGFIVESAAIELQDLTGGASGISDVSGPFGTGGVALLACIMCGIALAGFAWLVRSPLGLAMQAVAVAPAAARSIGIGPLPVRTVAFVLAAALAGLAGGLIAALNGFIAPSSFPFSQSIFYLLIVMVGGAGWTLGPLLGALVVGILPEALAGLAEYRLLFFGAALLVVLWIAPGGMAGFLARFVRSREKPSLAASSHPWTPSDKAGADLKGDNLRVAFGGVVAVDDVSLLARAGRVTSVIGPNGAGKTTLLNILSGFQASHSGSVAVGVSDVGGLSAHHVARAGLARTFQTAQPFAGLSVIDNVRLGLLKGRWRASASDVDARALLAFVGLRGRDDEPADALAHVDRRLLEIARALATSPSVILLDEPAAGLDRDDTTKLDGILRKLADAGLTVVLVEHDMALVMSVSDEVVVLDSGRRIATGDPESVRNNPAVKAAYLGTTAPPVPKSFDRTPGQPLLNVGGLRAGYSSLRVLDGLDLHVRQGETIALLGPNGAGKSTLMKALSGLLRPVDGSIKLGEIDLGKLPAHRVARAGLTLVPEGRQVFPRLTVAENLRLGATRRHDFDLVEIEEMLARFPRLRERLQTPAGFLSGGEQQMLAVARGQLSRPDILLLDEPSLGLAPAVAGELFACFAQLRDEGLTLVLVDQMTDYALSIADRGYVLGHGQIVLEDRAEHLRSRALDEAYFGASAAPAEALT